MTILKTYLLCTVVHLREKTEKKIQTDFFLGKPETMVLCELKQQLTKEVVINSTKKI